MLFDEAVKEKMEDFYDREEEINRLREGVLRGRRLILVLGVRRIGKSSLVKVTLNSIDVPFLYIDVRSVYRSHNYISSYALHYMVDDLISNLVASGKWSRIIDYIKHIRGISVYGVEVKN